MKTYFGILSGAAAFLALGLSLLLWNERRNAPMPPPIPFFHEFAPPSRSEIEAIEAYRAKVDAIREKYHGALLAILTEGQRKELEARRERAAEALCAREREFGPGPGPGPGHGPHGEPPPEFLLLHMVVYRPVLDLLVSDLKLDAAQRAKAAALLEARRAEVLRLVDGEPMPTFFQHDAARVEAAALP